MADDEAIDLLSEIFIRILQLEEKQKKTESGVPNRPQLLPNATRITDLINVLKSNCEVLGKELMNKSVAKKLKAKEEFMKLLEVKKKPEMSTVEPEEPVDDTLQAIRHDFTAKFNGALEEITSGDPGDAANGLKSLISIFALVLFCNRKPDPVCLTLVRSKLEQLLSGCTTQLANYRKQYHHHQQQNTVINTTGKVVTHLVMLDAALIKTILNNALLFELSSTLTPDLLSDLVEAMLPFIAFYESVTRTCSTDTAFANYYECFAVKLVFHLFEVQASDGVDGGTMRQPVVEPSTLVHATLKLLLRLARPESTIYSDYQMTAEKMANFGVKKVTGLFKVAVKKVTGLLKVAVMNVTRLKSQVRRLDEILLQILQIYEYVDVPTNTALPASEILPELQKLLTYCLHSSSPSFWSHFGLVDEEIRRSKLEHDSVPLIKALAEMGYKRLRLDSFNSIGSLVDCLANAPSGLLPAPVFGPNAPPPCCPVADLLEKVLSVEKQVDENSYLSRLHQIKEALDQKEPFVRSLLDQVDPGLCQTMSNEELLQAVANMRLDLAQQHKQIESISLMMMEEEEGKEKE